MSTNIILPACKSLRHPPAQRHQFPSRVPFLFSTCAPRSFVHQTLNKSETSNKIMPSSNKVSHDSSMLKRVLDIKMYNRRIRKLNLLATKSCSSNIVLNIKYCLCWILVFVGLNASETWDYLFIEQLFSLLLISLSVP